MSNWWSGIAPSEITIACAGGEHRVRWEAGRLVACDHGDVADERALAALGGEPFECVELVRAWERHHDDLRALVIGPRGGADELRRDPDSGSSGAAVVTRRIRSGGVSSFGRQSLRPGPRFIGRGDNDADDLSGLIELIRLGAGFGERLVATVAAAWAERLRAGDPRCADADARLHAGLYGRVFAALRGWLAQPGLVMELEMMAEGAARSLRCDGDLVHASLPFGWLVDVWGQSLTIVQGRFCLGAESKDGRDWVLRTVAPDLRTLERIELRIGD